MTNVSLNHLTKRYAAGVAPAVDDLSLAVGRAELVALLGPSGCGKTTTMKLIAGLLEPSAGDITFDRQSVVALPPEQRNVAMVFQKPLLFPYMNVAENIGFGLRMRCVPQADIARQVRDMLALVRLPGTELRRPQQLSGGQEQRIALARALVVQPRVLLLDEPLSQLDANLRGEMRELILSVQRRLAVTTIFVTHDQEEAVVLADKIALVLDGRLQQFGEPRAFYERPASARVARFFGGSNFIAGRKEGQRFISALGVFALPALPAADGAALLTVRPEAIVFGAASANSVRGVVRSSLYMGTQTRYAVAVGAATLDVVAEAASGYRAGEAVALTLPSARLWVIPEEAQQI